MSKWSEALESHGVHKQIIRLKQMLDETLEQAAKSSDEIDGHERITQALNFVEMRMKLTNPILVSSNQLDSLSKSVANVINSLVQYKNQKRQNFMNQAATQISSVVSNANSFLPLNNVVDQYDENQSSSVASYFSKISEYQTILQNKKEHLENDLDVVKNQLTKLTTNIDTQAQRADTSISNLQERFSSLESQWLQQFNEKILQDGQKKITETLDDLTKENEERQKLEVKNSEKVLTSLEKYKSQAENLLNVISNIGITGGYQKEADTERRAARLWQFLAFVSISGMIGFAINAFMLTLGSTISWSTLAARSLVIVTFSIMAGYSAKQADRHWQRERYNRSLELALAAINPFLSEFPDDKQFSIKEELANKLFKTPTIQDNKSKATNDISTNTLVELLKVAIQSTTKK